MEWLIIYKTHLYALFVIIGHDCDALMSDMNVASDAIFYHTINSWNSLEEKDSKVCPKTVGNKVNVVKILRISIHQNHILSQCKFCLQEVNWHNAQKYEILTVNLTGVPLSTGPKAPSNHVIKKTYWIFWVRKQILLCSMFTCLTII